MFHICQDEIIPIVASIPFIGMYYLKLKMFFTKRKTAKLLKKEGKQNANTTL